jgi:hypothetical protein
MDDAPSSFVFRRKIACLPFDFAQDERQHGTGCSYGVRFSRGAQENRTPLKRMECSVHLAIPGQRGLDLTLG